MSDAFHEIDQTRAAGKLRQHQEGLARFVKQGYSMVSQNTEKEEGLDHELISQTLTSILKPPSQNLPQLKFLAREIYGHYNYETGFFQEYETPKFELEVWEKGSDIASFNHPWERREID